MAKLSGCTFTHGIEEGAQNYWFLQTSSLNSQLGEKSALTGCQYLTLLHFSTFLDSPVRLTLSIQSNFNNIVTKPLTFTPPSNTVITTLQLQVTSLVK